MKRLDNESFELYRGQRVKENKETKKLLAGQLVVKLVKKGPNRATRRLNARIEQKYQTQKRLKKFEQLKRQMLNALKRTLKATKIERRSKYK